MCALFMLYLRLIPEKRRAVFAQPPSLNNDFWEDSIFEWLEQCVDLSCHDYI